MTSARSTGFHKFCQKWLPWLLIKCPLGNLHYRWRTTCICGLHFYCGGHNGNTYVYIGKGWWHRLGTDIAVQNSESPHPHYCVQHGGSPVTERYNINHGYTCPRCIEEWRNPNGT